MWKNQNPMVGEYVLCTIEKYDQVTGFDCLLSEYNIEAKLPIALISNRRLKKPATSFLPLGSKQVLVVVDNEAPIEVSLVDATDESMKKKLLDSISSCERIGSLLDKIRIMFHKDFVLKLDKNMEMRRHIPLYDLIRDIEWLELGDWHCEEDGGAEGGGAEGGGVENEVGGADDDDGADDGGAEDGVEEVADGDSGGVISELGEFLGFTLRNHVQLFGTMLRTETLEATLISYHPDGQNIINELLQKVIEECGRNTKIRTISPKYLIQVCANNYTETHKKILLARNLLRPVYKSGVSRNGNEYVSPESWLNIL